jgi:NOL1/NOP2/fmu family ribosome biogenesis protein
VLKAYSANKPDACAAVQREILKYASVMLKAGGRLVYSTCTFNDMENEGTVAAFLEKHEDFVLVKMRRIWPHKEKGEGHFVAVLEKAGEGGERTHSESTIKPPREFAEFCRGMLEYDFGEGAFVMHGKNLYFQRVPLDLRGIRVARSGWFLGECAKGRFVPSHALAMGLKKEQARFSVELSEQDAWRYLKGETLEFQGNSAFDDLVESDKPYVLMCYKSYPLGWARLVQGRLKNNLPVGWAVK